MKGIYKNLIFLVYVLLPSISFSQGNRIWATYYGNSGNEQTQNIAIDAAGNVYQVGITGSATGIASGGYQNIFGGGATDAFIVKFDPNGNRMWATYFGGAGDDNAYGITIDPAGNIYVCGSTSSTTNIAFGGHQNFFGGGFYDAYLAKFNSAGNLIWSTYYGGTENDFSSNSPSVDLNGNVFLAGQTRSTNNIATVGALQTTYAGAVTGTAGDAYLVKFDANGNRLWGTYYGGPLDDLVYAPTATDAAGNVFLAGRTFNTIGMSSGGFQNTFGGGPDDAFLVKFDANGNRLWATYYGGTGVEESLDLITNAAGDVFMTGYTGSNTGIASGGYQNVFGGAAFTLDAFIVKFDGNGNRIWGTYYGGAGRDEGRKLVVSQTGNIFLGGDTDGTAGIAFNGFQNNLIGTKNSFVVEFDSNMNRLCATYYGDGYTSNSKIAVNATDNVYLQAWTNSATNISSGGFQNTFGGVRDGVVAKFSPCANIVTAGFNSVNLSGCEGLSVNFNNTSTGANAWNWDFGDGNSSTAQSPTHVYTNAGQYTVVLISTDGITSDTLTQVNYITIYPWAVATFTPTISTICLGQSVTFNNTSTNATSYSWDFGDGTNSSLTNPLHTYTNTGNYNVTLIASNINGCDDTLIVPVVVKPNSSFIQNPSICSGQNYILPGGAIVNTAGTYIDTISSINGCDSIITTNLSVVNAIPFAQNPTICSGQTFSLPTGVIVNTAGTYIDTISAAGGCDSIITTTLIVTIPNPINLSATFCTGASYTLPGGAAVTAPGNYSDTLTTSAGCDSIINTALSLSPPIVTNQALSLCAGTSYTLPGGAIVTVGGVYHDTLTTTKGCDSIINTTLSFVPALFSSQSHALCNGTPFTLPGGLLVVAQGVYIDTIPSVAGCDSVITTTLNYKPHSSSLLNITICANQTYTLPNGIIVSVSGVYYDTITSINGCDSTITTNLTVNPTPTVTTSPSNTITLGSSVTLTGTGFGNYNWYPATNLNTTTGNIVIATPTQTTTYCVEVTSPNGCKDTACITIEVEIPCPANENLQVPNAFSPNGDGINDEFCLQGWTPCNEKFIIMIYDRWGEKIFESKDPNFCWDGKHNGKVFDAAVFVYYIKASFLDREKTINLRGNISLIK